MQQRSVIFGIFLQLSMMFSTPVQALGTLILDGSQGEYALGRVFDILEDPLGDLSINDVISPEYANQFSPSQVDVPNFGMTQSVYWLRWRLQNRTTNNTKWLLDQGFANTQFMDLYQARSDGDGFRVRKSGNLRPYSNRDIPHRRIIFSIELPENSEQIYYLRVESGASMTLDLSLRTWPNLALNDGKESFWMGLFYGALIIFVGYSLFSFFVLRDPRYAWLVIFILMISTGFAFYDGYAQQLMGDDLLFVRSVGVPLFFALSFTSLIKLDQVSVSTSANIVNTGQKIFLVAWVVLILTIPFVAYGTIIKFLIFFAFLTIIAVIAHNALNWSKNRRLVSFTLIAWSFSLIAMLVFSLSRLALLDDSMVKDQVTRISLLWVVFVMSLAYVDRINMLRRKAERATSSLRESETQHRLAMQASNTGTWSWDIATNKTQWSDETEVIFGLKKGGFDGQYATFRQFIHPQDIDYLEQKIADAIKLNKPYFVEHRIIRADGEQRWLAGFGEVFRDQAGHPITMLGTVRDITHEKHSEQELLQQEKKYRSLFNMANDGILLLRDGHIIDCNPRALELYGYARDELLGKTPVEVSPELQPDGSVSAQVADAMADRVLERANKETFEWRHLHKDGSEFDVEVSINSIELGGESLLQAVLRDITDRKRSEEAIKNIAAGVSAQTGKLFFKQLVLHLAKLFKADHAFIGGLDENDPMVVHTYSLYAHGEIIDNISYSLKDTPCAEMVQGTACSYPRNVRRLFPKDKLLVDMDVESYIGTRLFDSTGQVIGILVILDSKPMENIDYIQEILAIFAARASAEMERLKSEQKLAKAEQRLSLHVKQTPLGVIEWDKRFRVTAWNPAAERIFGFTTDEAIGRHASELILSPAVIPHVDKIWQDLLSQNGGFSSTNENCTKDGNTIVCEWYNTPLVTETNKVVGVASLVADISDRVLAQQELNTYRDHLEDMIEERTSALSAVNKELESFSYSVSHDLRAPLRTINGFSLALIEDYGGQLNIEGKDYLKRLRSASLRMDGLIQNMLSLSRINRQEIQIQQVSLTEMANEIVEQYQSADPQRQVEIKIQTDMQCQCDSNLMGIALDNLLGNAWKYTSKVDSAKIEFGIKVKDKDATYYIKDNGAGFDMKYVNKIFDAFQRLHHARDFEGSGVGLATVVRVINRHGGHIWAEAIPNEGATFYFTLRPRKKLEYDNDWREVNKTNAAVDHEVH